MKKKSLLTASIFGVISTAIVSCYQTKKILDIINDEYYDQFPNKKKILAKKIVKKALPIVVCSGSTIVSICCMNKSALKYQAKLLSTLNTYGLLLSNHKKALRESSDSRNIISNMADNISEKTTMPVDADNQQLYFEEFSQRFFYSKPDDVIAAMYKFNRNFLLAYGERSISEFFDFLGLDEEENHAFESFGYNAYKMEQDGLRPWIDWIFKKETLKNGTSYISLGFVWDPIFEYWDLEE